MNLTLECFGRLEVNCPVLEARVLSSPALTDSTALVDVVLHACEELSSMIRQSTSTAANSPGTGANSATISAAVLPIPMTTSSPWPIIQV
ncbi:tkl tkl-ccin protein kinase [Moniliophthora roreri]|nr:tkl tkl-ccin protein kinase [Moniliophthora roreri]